MSRAQGCAGATMSTEPNPVESLNGGHECPPYGTVQQRIRRLGEGPGDDQIFRADMKNIPAF